MLITVLTYIAVAFMYFIGGFSSIAMIIGIPGILIWKLWRMKKYGKKFTD